MSFELTSTAELLALWAVAGYLLGAIPFGIVTARLLGLGDLRKIGSGNIGATNVLRTGSKLGAALTLIGDAGKAGAAVLWPAHWRPRMRRKLPALPLFLAIATLFG